MMKIDRHQRWRLILGRRSEEPLSTLGGQAPPEAILSDEMRSIDNALAALYEPAGESGGLIEGRARQAGLDAGSGVLAQWLGDIRKYFDQDIVVLLQQDAIERHGLKQLLYEPELLSKVTPSVELVATLLTLKNMIPDRTKETARLVVARVVEEIKKRIKTELERAVRGALDRSRHQPLPNLANLDWKRTIEASLKNYVPERRIIVPDRLYFYARQQRQREWNVIICMDQSGSMAESVVYASVMGAILASIPALETHVIAFDTEVVDLTSVCTDPVDMLFGVQLGGGTDINRAVSYCQELIHNAKKTLFILITDLYEGGDGRELVQRLEQMVTSGTRALCLLALNDHGAPSYDATMAQKVRNIGLPCFACTPNLLPDLLCASLKN